MASCDLQKIVHGGGFVEEILPLPPDVLPRRLCLLTNHANSF